jgi:hypothetical protein
MLCILGLKILDSLLYKAGATYYFKIYFNFFPVNLCKCLGENLLHVVRIGSLLDLLGVMLMTTNHEVSTN